MDESKIELTERLRRENRWEEASNFRETARADFRAKGMNRKEAAEAAWASTAESYPPLPVANPVAATDNGRVQGLGEIPES